jgi:predicted transcriptional regulator
VGEAPRAVTHRSTPHQLTGGHHAQRREKTISLPPDLANEAEEIARAEGKTLSAVIQDALRAARLQGELRGIQRYWCRKAKEKGVLTDKDLKRCLGE